MTEQRTAKRNVLRRMKVVREVVMDELRGNGEGKFGRGLSSEGFAGGYLQALDDIDGALTHGEPSDHRGYWREANARIRRNKGASPHEETGATNG